MQRHVIIGNGVAGVNAAETIRSLDPEAAITMVAAETFPPYSRPMISLVLEGSVTAGRLPIRSEDWYEKQRIEPVTGERAAELDTDRRVVRTDGNRTIPFDRLLIASGADPRHIKAEGAGLGNIFFMRTAEHVRGMTAALPDVRQALVLGGGLVGFKAAYGLLHRGVKVTMLIKSKHPLALQVDDTAGRLLMTELQARGLTVLVNVEAVAFEGDGRVREAHLSDGTRLPCQLVVIGKGVLPAISYVPRDKIEVDLGVRVNHYLETSCPGIYAAGDCAESVDVARQTPWVNAVWPVAVEQGRLAGANMAGRPVVYPGSLGRNVIRIFGLDVLTGGVIDEPAGEGYDVYTLFNPARRMYRKLVVKDGRLTGLVMVGNIEQGGVLLSLIQRRAPLNADPEKLLEPSFNVGSLWN